MAKKLPKAEKALSDLQRLVRQPPRDERTVRTRRLPEALITDDQGYLYLYADEETAFQDAQQVLLDDLRFEHLGEGTDEAVWRFVAEAHVDRTRDHVHRFVEQHGNQPVELTCYIPVEYLAVSSVTAIVGLLLLPPAADEVPSTSLGFFSLAPPVGSVAAVSVMGTDRKRMAERAAVAAEHALRVLRVALREHRSIHDRQLRFRTSPSFAFKDGISGWQERSDKSYDLTLDDGLIALATSQPVVRLPVEPRNRLERKAACRVGLDGTSIVRDGTHHRTPLPVLCFRGSARRQVGEAKGGTTRVPPRNAG